MAEMGLGGASAAAMEIDRSSAAANKTLTGELATKEKIAAYHIDVPPLSFSKKVLAFIELVGVGYVLYQLFYIIIHHVTHLLHLFHIIGGGSGAAH